MSDSLEKNKSIEAASEYYDADIFFYSGEIDYDGYGKLVSAASSAKSRTNVLLIIITNGGSANAGYPIARFLQKLYYPGKLKIWGWPR